MLPAASHLARAAVLTIAVVGAVLGPCVPGSYDPLALPLSMVARCASWALLLFVPIGAAWWVRDVIVGLPLAARALGVVTVGAATLVSVVVVIAAAAFGGAMLAAACAATAVVMLRHRAARWTAAAATMETGALALLYLVIVPGLVFILQRQLFEPAVDANRARLIAAAGPLMTQIEEHRARRGAYPESLLSVTTDYRPRSRSVSQFVVSTSVHGRRRSRKCNGPGSQALSGTNSLIRSSREDRPNITQYSSARRSASLRSFIALGSN